MMNSHTSLRTLSALALTALLAVSVTACDGSAPGDVTTRTAALTAELQRTDATMTYDVIVRLTEPLDATIDLFGQADGAAADVEIGIDLFPSGDGFIDLSSITESYSATVQAVANNEYIGEREAREAVSEPVYAVLPVAACGGVFPCDLGLRITFERDAFIVESPLAVEMVAWGATHHDLFDIIEIIEGTGPSY